MTVDLTQLSVAERIQLVEDLWDSITVIPDSVPVTQAQRDELDRRLVQRVAPASEDKTWQQVKADIKQRVRS